MQSLAVRPGRAKLKSINQTFRVSEFEIKQPSTFLPQAEVAMSNEWKTYRTRFLIQAKQLTFPLTFVDCLGREHRGVPGDYLVETSDGMQRIAPRAIFEDIYVAMNPAFEKAATGSTLTVDTTTAVASASLAS